MLPLKHLSNFWRTLEMQLINCEIAGTKPIKSRFYRRGVPAEETKQQKRLCGLWCYRRYLR